MKKYIFVLLVLSCSIFKLIGQNQNNLWYFGTALTGPPWNTTSFGLDFSGDGSPVQVNNQSALSYYESVSVASDENGILQFYSNGIEIMDASHQLMLGAPAALQGSQQGITASSVQGAYHLKIPGSDDRFLLFTTGAEDGSGTGLRFSEIDLSLPGNGTPGAPLGEVISFDNLLEGSSGEMMTSYGGCGSDTVWIIAHQESSINFTRVLVTKDGVQSTVSDPVPMPNGGTSSDVSNAGSLRGSMDINNDGTKLIFTAQSPAGTFILDFNSHTGALSNPIKILNPIGNTFFGYGSEFSPDGNFAYFAHHQVAGLFQYDVNNETSSWVTPSNIHAEIITGPDGVLYIGKPTNPGSMTLAVIEFPDVDVNSGSVGYNLNAIDFSSAAGINRTVSYAMPQGFTCSVTQECVIDAVSDQCDTTTSFQLSANPIGGFWSGSYVTPEGMFDPTAAGPGDHWVVYDAGCDQPDSLQITVATCCPDISPDLGPDISVCSDETHTLDAGAGFDSYEWIENGVVMSGETGFSIEADSGTYIVNITDGDGCPGSDTIEIGNNQLPEPDFGLGENSSFCTGSLVTLDAGPGMTTYRWYENSVLMVGEITKTIEAGAGTYVVEVVDANGCLGIESIELSASPLPSPTIDGDNIFCENESINIIGLAGSGGTLTWSDLGSFSTPRSISSPGTYWLIEEDANGCVDSVSHIVTQKDAPSISITPPTVSCSNDLTENLFATPSGGEWFINNVSISPGVLNLDSLGDGDHEIKYQVTVDGCSGADSIVHSINSAPEISNMPSNSFLCLSEPAITLSADPSGGQWYTDSETSTDQFNPGVLGLGVHNVKYVVSNAALCSDSDSVTITVIDVPNVVIDSVISSCDNQDIETLNASPSGGSWYVNNILSSNQFNPVALGEGTYNIKYVFSNPSGCSDSDSVSVVINVAPEVDLGPSTFFCSGDSVSLNAGPGFSDYEWSSGDSVQVIYVNSPGPISVVVTDANGCSGTSSVHVSANDIPTVELGGSVVVCEQDSVTIGAVHPDAFSYTWLPGTESDATIRVGSEDATYTVTIVDNDGCKFTDSVQISEENLPTVSLGPDTIICDNVTETLDATASSDVAYAWYLDGVIISDENGQTLKADSGEYIVIVSTENGCESSDTINIDNHQLPNVIIDSEYEFCQFDSVEIDLGSVGESYLWTTGDTTQSIWAYSAGVISVEVTDLNSCEVSVNTTLIENLLPVLDLGANDSACVGLEIELNAQPTEGVGPYTFLWSDGSIDPFYNLVGPDTLSVIVTGDNNCAAYDTIGIAALDSLDLSFIPSNNQSCAGAEEDHPLDAGDFPGAIYEWTLPDGSTENTQVIVPLLNGVYAVLITDVFNCKGIGESTNLVVPVPNIDLGPDTVFCADGNATFDIRMEFSDYIPGLIDWEDGLGNTENNNTNDTLFTASYTPITVMGTFTDVATGCIHTDTIELKEFCLPTIIEFPNTIVTGGTDGGGSSNPFRPIGMTDDNLDYILNNIRWSDFEVYNRWGIKVFQSEDILPSWDASFEGLPVSAGVYYWIYRYKDSSQKVYSLNGFVQLIQAP